MLEIGKLRDPASLIGGVVIGLHALSPASRLDLMLSVNDGNIVGIREQVAGNDADLLGTKTSSAVKTARAPETNGRDGNRSHRLPLNENEARVVHRGGGVEVPGRARESGTERIEYL